MWARYGSSFAKDRLMHAQVLQVPANIACEQVHLDFSNMARAAQELQAKCAQTILSNLVFCTDFA